MHSLRYRKHESAQIDDSTVGDGSSVGAGSILRNGVRTGENCAIADYVVLDGPVEIAEDAVIDSHCYLGGPASIGPQVRFLAHSCLRAEPGGAVIVKARVVIGANATIVGALTIGEGAVIEAGSVVTKNVPPNAVVSGNPAKIVRYGQALPGSDVFRESATAGPPGRPVTATRVRGVSLHHLPLFEDLRGNLSFGEIGRHVPFDIKRYFLTFDVTTEEARGEHAHRTVRQFIVCVHGTVHLFADDGENREEFVLDRPNLALYLPPFVWGVQYRFSPGAVLLVLCSDFYDPADYIRDYGEFLKEAAAQRVRTAPTGPYPLLEPSS